MSYQLFFWLSFFTDLCHGWHIGPGGNFLWITRVIQCYDQKVCFQNAIQRTAQSQGRPTHIAYSFLLTLDHANILKCRNKFYYHTLYSSSVPSQIYSLCVPNQPNRVSVSFNTEKTITRTPCYPREKVETNKQTKKTPSPELRPFTMLGV